LHTGLDVRDCCVKIKNYFSLQNCEMVLLKSLEGGGPCSLEENQWSRVVYGILGEEEER